MRLKPVPAPPATLDGVASARRTVPLVPGTEGDCCSRLETRLGCAPDEARRWLTFLRALGLAGETSRGFVRTDAPLERDALADAFRERVFGAREVVGALDADDPTDADAAFERFRDRAPAWERAKRSDWAAEWRERVARLLEWAALFGLAERTESGYRRTA